MKCQFNVAHCTNLEDYNLKEENHFRILILINRSGKISSNKGGFSRYFKEHLLILSFVEKDLKK